MILFLIVVNQQKKKKNNKKNIVYEVKCWNSAASKSWFFHQKRKFWERTHKFSLGPSKIGDENSLKDSQNLELREIPD